MNDHQGRQTLDPDHTFLAGLFRRNGYTTFGTGKWHNDKPSFARSFSEVENVFFGGYGQPLRRSGAGL